MRITLHCLLLMFVLTGGILRADAAPPLMSESIPLPTPGSIITNTDSITYFAKNSDTLTSIAQQYTNSRDNWQALAKINRVDKDISFPVGFGITIPVELLADDPIEAKVVAMSGNITATAANGATNIINVGTTITEGMQIETGNSGFITMSLPDASRISLPSNSRAILAKLRMSRYTNSPRTEIMLLAGHVASRVTTLEANKGRFDVRTPLSVTGVIGTNFRVGIEGNHVTNEVIEGKVDVTRNQGDTPVVLVANTGNIVDGKSVGAAINLLPPPHIAPPEDMQNFSAPQFKLLPVGGATAYHVQVSTDAVAENVIAETRSTTTKVQVDVVHDGNYFVHVAAIDKLGLRGATRTQAFTLKTRSESTIKAPHVEHSDDKLVTLRWPAQAGKNFTLQIARDPEFSLLIFTTSTDKSEAIMPRPPFGTYYARVQSSYPDGSGNLFSSAQTFIVTDQWVMNDGASVNMKEARTGAYQ